MKMNRLGFNCKINMYQSVTKIENNFVLKMYLNFMGQSTTTSVLTVYKSCFVFQTIKPEK